MSASCSMRARLAEVGHHRPLVGALLGATVELRERDDRDLELLGEQLDLAGELRDLDLAGLDLLAAGHQLEVVDHDQPEVVALLEPAGLRPDLHHRHVGAVVDEHRRRGDLGPSCGTSLFQSSSPMPPLRMWLSGTLASAESSRIVISERDHLEAEDHGGLVVGDGRRPAEVQRQRRLPDRGTGRRR